jgi:hypothetical protein
MPTKTPAMAVKSTIKTTMTAAEGDISIMEATLP